MVSKDNKFKGSERRGIDRRIGEDRRTTIRFGDVLGRRSGVERRLGWKQEAEKELDIANESLGNPLTNS
jgi:hypothetical protein